MSFNNKTQDKSAENLRVLRMRIWELDNDLQDLKADYWRIRDQQHENRDDIKTLALILRYVSASVAVLAIFQSVIIYSLVDWGG